MPTTKFMTVEGSKSGKIQGEVTKQGMEGKIGIVAFAHSVSNEGGKRKHDPIVVVKAIDKSTPLLFQALCTNEELKSVQIDFVKANPSGAEEVFYTIKLSNARISSIKEVNQSINGQHDSLKFGEYEQVAFSYQKITWTIHDGGIETEDESGATRA